MGNLPILLDWIGDEKHRKAAIKSCSLYMGAKLLDRLNINLFLCMS